MSTSPAGPGESSSVSQLAGVWAAAITPRRASGHEIDLGAALDVVGFLQDFDLDGISILGATGEFVHFDIADRIKFGAMAVKRSRKPVIVNASHSTYPGTLKLADEALGSGAAAVLILPPYFYRYSQASVVAFYSKLARELRGPVLAYNLPFFTTPIESDTLLGLLESGAITGVKDSSGQNGALASALTAKCCGERRIFVGNDALLVDGLGAGADGVISGVACMAPELIIRLAQAIAAGNRVVVDELSELLAECLAWLDRFAVPMGIKLASNERGMPGGYVAVPSGPEEKEQFDAFTHWFRDWLARVRA